MSKTTIPHPGVLIKGLLESSDVSITQSAKLMGMHKQCIYLITSGRRDVTPTIAVRLGKYFGTGTLFWLNKQSEYDAMLAEQEVDTSSIPLMAEVGQMSFIAA